MHSKQYLLVTMGGLQPPVPFPLAKVREQSYYNTPQYNDHFETEGVRYTVYTENFGILFSCIKYRAIPSPGPLLADKYGPPSLRRARARAKTKGIQG